MKSRSGFCELGFAKVDTDRLQRRGCAEAIFCLGKTPEQIKKIAFKLIAHKQDVLLTKLENTVFTKIKKAIPRLRYNAAAKIAYCFQKKNTPLRGSVLVLSAGTSDIPIAEEAAVTSEVMGNRTTRLYDVGVAGVHRLMEHRDMLRKAKVIIVVAGMEGALASVVSGLVRSPVIAVPTSCGYGAHFGGLAALLTMINSCSPGVVVVNIDNGFGAGYFASLVNN